MSVKDFKILIDDHQWDEAIALIKSDPSVTKKHYPLPAFVNEWKGVSDVYPIHHACSMMDTPLELIEVLLFAYPDCVEKTESALQRTCLHIAILKNLPDNIVSRLIDVYPDAVQQQDKFGRVPLHYACSNSRSSESLKQLIMPFPQCIQAPDWKMWTPFHVAVTKNTDPDIITFMLSLCPEAVASKNDKGKNALTLASESYHTLNKDRIREIVRKKGVELDELPESQNLRTATTIRPQTPLNMESYCLV